MDVDTLIARQEITDVIKRLVRGTDRLDAELIASCYHPDGIDDHNAFRGSGVAFAAWVCEVLPHFVATHHFVADPYIRVIGAAADVDTYCEAHHVGVDTDLVLGLRYVDRFERRRGEWRILRRVCAFDWTYTVELVPERRMAFGPDFTLGRRDRDDISYHGVGTPSPG